MKSFQRRQRCRERKDLPGGGGDGFDFGLKQFGSRDVDRLRGERQRLGCSTAKGRGPQPHGAAAICG
jgi:hypothetical protein